MKTSISGGFHRFVSASNAKRWCNVCTVMALLQICSKKLSVRLPVCPVNKNKVLSLYLFPDRFKAVPLFFYIHVACFVRFVFLLCSSECFFFLFIMVDLLLVLLDSCLVS